MRVKTKLFLREILATPFWVKKPTKISFENQKRQNAEETRRKDFTHKFFLGDQGKCRDSLVFVFLALFLPCSFFF